MNREKICKTCGVSFIDRRADAKYCSYECGFIYRNKINKLKINELRVFDSDKAYRLLSLYLSVNISKLDLDSFNKIYGGFKCEDVEYFHKDYGLIVRLKDLLIKYNNNMVYITKRKESHEH